MGEQSKRARRLLDEIAQNGEPQIEGDPMEVVVLLDSLACAGLKLVEDEGGEAATEYHGVIADG
jgi:hypothetical protein